MKNKCGIKGVHKTNNGEKYRTQISVKNKDIYLGTFLTAQEAEKAYNEALLKYRLKAESHGMD
jgi:hypothetical protein